MNRPSHLQSDGSPGMVDIHGKTATLRRAKARAVVVLPPAVAERFRDGDLRVEKGPVFHTAIIAGVLAAKRTGELIPLCHSLPLEDCRIRIDLNGNGEAVIVAEAAVNAKTGVEMEALTAVSVAALTIYDMCKGLSHGIVIRDVRLLSKTGGTSDYAVGEAEEVS